jgi:PAS domain S-box-containing protein
MMQAHAAGVLIVSSEGKCLHASGMASEEGVSEAILRKWRSLPEQHGRLFAIEDGPHRLSVVAAGSGEVSAFVCFRRGSNDVLFEFAATVAFADDILRHLLTSPYEALTVVDRNGFLRFISPVHERFFGLGRGEAAGKHVTDVIENTRLHEVARTGKAEIGQIQQMRGTTRVVTRMPVLDAEGNVVAAIGQVMFKGPEQLQTLSGELARLRSEVSEYQRALASRSGQPHGLDRIIGQSAAIRRLKDQIARIAPLDVPVLLVGESGTGKELAAHAIHVLSRRRDESLVTVNAAALPASLVESELFGYEPGAFTGAERKGRRGKFEQAHKGTLFFDEIGDMPLEMQVKLLRVLQDGSFERVGGDKPRSSDYRLISASNRDFQGMIDAKEFRLDLFYRVSAVTLQLPPLRDRLEDIELLAKQALYDFAIKHSTRQKLLSREAVEYLQRQQWPGNVRQLMHVIDSAAIFSDSGVITVDDFQFPGQQLRPVHPEPPASGPAAVTQAEGAAGSAVRVAVEQVEERLIRDAMVRCGGNKKRVATELGISRSYLYKRLAAIALD